MTDTIEAPAPTDTPPELEKIPANDPRMQDLWANIAKEAIKVGQMDHYLTIAKSLGAPTVEELRRSGALTGKTHWKTYIYVEFDTDLTDGRAMDDFTAEDFRRGLAALVENDDPVLKAMVQREDHRIVWDR